MNEISINRFSTMCRLCLESSVTMSDIFAFSTKMRNQLIADIIMNCAPVKITRCDGFPNFICQLCFTQLEKSHQFQTQVVQSDKTLRHYLQQQLASDKQPKTECSLQDTSEVPYLHETNSEVAVKSEPAEVTDVFDAGKPTNALFSTDCASVNSFRDAHSEIIRQETNTDLLNEDMNIDWNEKETGRFYAGPGHIETNQIKTECSIQGPPEDPALTEKCDITSLHDVDDINADSKNRIIKNAPFKSEIKNELTDDTFIFLPEYSEDTEPENVDERQTRKRIASKTTKLIQGNVCKQTGEKPYQCDLCKKCFARSDILNNHKRTHTGERPYQCDLCNKCFSSSGNLHNHKRIHTGEKPYQCDVCSRCFPVSRQLIDHKRTHTGDKPYQCDFCKKCFTRSDILNIHKRTHTGEKPYQCDLCKKRFSHLHHLNTHKLIHTGEKPYKCDVCSKCFTASRQLNNHKRTHTGDKPYQCDVCKKCFTRSDILNIHKRTHTAEKPYHCDSCNKCFTSSGNLHIHKRIHTGDKPYQCDMCKKCFTRSDILNIHKRTHTSEKPYQCVL